MIARIKALGLAAGASMDVTHAARRVRAYVEGATPEHGVIEYYGGAASVLDGRTHGSLASTLALGGTVDGVMLERLLSGRHPSTAEPLVSSLGRLAQLRPLDSDPWIDLAGAAAFAGVSARYLRRLAEDRPRTRYARPTVVRDPRVAAALVERLSGHRPEPRPRQHLLARRQPDGTWQVHRDELARFVASRPARRRVMAFDLTLSAPKSVSLLWAFGDAATREVIATAFDAAIEVAVAYLERHATEANVAGSNRPGEGLVVAAYRHDVSRDDEPHLHTHCLIANLTGVADPDTGAMTWRAVDGDLLLKHHVTAGYLAAATFRRELTERLGVAWLPVSRGVAELVGFPRTLLAHFSSRHREIEQEYAALLEAGYAPGGATDEAAQVSTRQAKRVRADAEVVAIHMQRLIDYGWRPEQIRALARGTAAVRTLGEGEIERVFAELCGRHGLTERVAQFDRQDVVRALAVRLGDRLSGAEIDTLTDRLLLDDRVVACAAVATVRRHQQRAARYTTVELLAVEDTLLSLWQQGRVAVSGLQHAPVDTATVERVLRGWSARGLSVEQLDAVAEVLRSGDLVRVLVGPAGSGKTEAIGAAIDAWGQCGYNVVGTANGGRQAQQLHERAGIGAEVVASWLTRLDHAADPTAVWERGTVVLLDEATQVSTRDAERLVRYATRTGSVLVALGDPGQLSSVGAGGWFHHLAAADGVAVVRELRRQDGDAMRPVRAALTALRSQLPARVDDALQLLATDGRLRVCASRAELLRAAVADWYADRHAQPVDDRPDSAAQRVRMLAAFQRDVDVLNRAARVHLAADGTLRGAALDVAGREFRVGDEVVTLTQRGHTIVPDGAGPRAYIRTGTIGTVVEVHHDPQHLLRQWMRVDFGSRGVATVPWSYLEFDFGDGRRGGLAHAYALTADRAQGSTMDAARAVATDATGRQALYVMLSRGRRDVAAYVIRRRDLDVDATDEAWLPVLADNRSALERVTARLKASRPERLASDLDPTAAAAHAVATQYGLGELARMRRAALGRSDASPSASLLVRAERLAEHRVAGAALLSPPAALVRQLGPRPEQGAARRAWEDAVGAHAVFVARYQARDGVGDHAGEAQWAAMVARTERLVQGCIDRARAPKCSHAVRVALRAEVLALLASGIEPAHVAKELLRGPVRDGAVLVARARAFAVGIGVDGSAFRGDAALSRADDRQRCAALLAVARQLCAPASAERAAAEQVRHGRSLGLG